MPAGHFVAIGLFGEPKQLIDFGTQAAFQCQQALGADGLTLGSIRMHLGAVHADVAELEIAGRLGQ